MIEQKITKGSMKQFFSKYGVYFIVGFCVLFFAILIIIASVSGNSESKSVEVPVSNKTVVTFTNPLANATIYKDYNNESLVYNSTLKQWEAHMCVDLIASDTTNVCAIYDGTVSNIYSNYLEGTVVEIQHENGLTSRYASLDETLKVSLGDKVSSGDILGSASNTANKEQNIGNYLSLTILDESGNKIDPSNYLTLTGK